MKYYFFLGILITTLFLSGCSTRGKGAVRHNTVLKPYVEFSKNKNSVKSTLYIEYKKWRGTPYKYGGTSKTGTDCSGFVQSVYNNAFGLSVPRTTKEQSHSGFRVSKSDLKAGDLLLFKTSLNARHSGIYIENGNFIHSSTTKGVMTSNLSGVYWEKNYWQSRRVLP